MTALWSLHEQSFTAGMPKSTATTHSRLGRRWLLLNSVTYNVSVPQKQRRRPSTI